MPQRFDYGSGEISIRFNHTSIRLAQLIELVFRYFVPQVIFGLIRPMVAKIAISAYVGGMNWKKFGESRTFGLEDEIRACGRIVFWLQIQRVGSGGHLQERASRKRAAQVVNLLGYRPLFDIVGIA